MGHEGIANSHDFIEITDEVPGSDTSGVNELSNAEAAPELHVPANFGVISLEQSIRAAGHGY